MRQLGAFRGALRTGCVSCWGTDEHRSFLVAEFCAYDREMREDILAYTAPATLPSRVHCSLYTYSWER